MGVIKEKAEPNNPKVSMAKEGEKDVKVEEDVAKSKYPFSEIYDYVVHKTYPSHSDKLYRHGLRKRSKFFTADGGHILALAHTICSYMSSQIVYRTKPLGP